MIHVEILKSDRERGQQLFDASYSKEKQREEIALKGFIGEAIFERLYPDACLLPKKKDQQDGGLDFVLNGHSVDVKVREVFTSNEVPHFGFNYNELPNNREHSDFLACFCFSLQDEVAIWWGFVECGKPAKWVTNNNFNNYTEKEFRSWISYKS